MVKQVQSFINKHPKFTFLLIGLATSLVLSAAVMRYADSTIEEYRMINRTVIEEYKVKVVEQTAKIETLTEENRKLKSRTVTYKIIKPDGTIEERTESEIESEEQISVAVKEEYERKLREEVTRKAEEYAAKIESIASTRRRLGIDIGMVGDLTAQRWYTHATYDVLVPFTVGAGVVFGPIPGYMLSVGIRL